MMLPITCYVLVMCSNWSPAIAVGLTRITLGCPIEEWWIRPGVHRLAAEHRLRVETTRYPLDRADVALTALAGDRVHGAAVLIP
jgi:hypothetical protein